MARYVIERELPGAGRLTPEQLHDVSAQSNAVLANMAGIEWVQSYVGQDKIYCVYDADDPELIRRHGEAGGFPVTSISEVSAVISPETGR